MSAPRTVDDGTSLTARQHGAIEWEFPFANEGDGSAFVATITMRQDQSRFRPLAPMTRINTSRGIGYLVSGEDTRYIGQGRVEWKRIVANVPKTRTVPGGTASMGLQFLITETPPVGSPTYTVEDITFAVPTTLTYEYSTKKFEVKRAPKVFTYNSGFSYGTVGGWANVKAGDNILVQDSEQSLYRGLIYCRVLQKAIVPVTLNE